MQNNTLKSLAQKAKKRLSSAGQNYEKTNGEKQTLAYLTPTNYAIVVSKQKIEEDPLFEKVKKLLEKDEIYNPLGELTDKSIFDLLSSIEKEKYIMDISKRYNEIKEYFISQGI